MGRPLTVGVSRQRKMVHFRYHPSLQALRALALCHNCFFRDVRKGLKRMGAGCSCPDGACHLLSLDVVSSLPQACLYLVPDGSC